MSDYDYDVVDNLSIAKEIENKVQDLPQPRRKAVELGGLPDADRRRLKKLSGQAKHEIRGAAGKKLVEPVPKFIRVPCEKVIQGKNNTFIVMGRDRHRSRFSGYGGKGHTKAGMIDIVVGRLGSHSPYKAKGKSIRADPDFQKDSARIYLSQRSDVDGYFNLVASPGAPNTNEENPVSTVGLKADVVRIIGRQNIRLVTQSNIKNSMGAYITSRGGIDLVAGNDDSDIQPLVKGNNLIAAITELAEMVDDLRSTFNGFVTYQLEYNGDVAYHFHQSPFFGGPTSPSVAAMQKGAKVMMDIFSNTIVSTKTMAFNIESFKKNYLSPAISDPANPGSDQFICSRFNNTN